MVDMVMAGTVRNLALALVTTASAVAAHAQQFVCSFPARVRIDASTLERPSALTEQTDDRYTFIISGSKAGYINLRYGDLREVTAIKNGSVLAFVERTQSDNYFVASVFLQKGSPGKRPALFTFNGWPDFHPHYRPSTSVGTCEERD